MESQLFLIIIFSVFFCISAAHLSRINGTFAIYYAFLFMYTIFTQIGYVFYPDLVNALSAHQYYGPEAFTSYWSFVALSFLGVYLTAVHLLQGSRSLPWTIKLRPIRYSYGSRKIPITAAIFVLFVGLIQVFLVSELVFNFSMLGYRTVEILKSNKFWYYFLYLDSLIIYLLFAMLHAPKTTQFPRGLCLAFLIICSGVSLVTNVKIGGRIVLFFLFSGLIGFYVPHKVRLSSTGLIGASIKLLGVIALAIMFSQSITAIRGQADLETMSGFYERFFGWDSFTRLFDFENLITQDYFVPSLTIFTSIQYDITDPYEVLRSNLSALIPLIEHVTLGGYFVRLLNPMMNAGYGYYILTEGYNFMGFAGFIYNALVFVCGFKLLYDTFANTENPHFNRIARGLVAFVVVSVVRGQSMYFIKAIYYIFIPALLMYCWLTNQRVILSRRSSATPS